MAFFKYAYATTVEPAISGRGWSKIRTASGGSDANLVEKASAILGENFDPSRYLLTHATIVASVDVEEIPNVRLGAVLDPNTGRRINRKWNDYRIKPECDKFINNNNDSWARPVLMKSYRTFIGAHNFCEHLQKEEESKGRIIDAVARDIGPSVYVDILLATDRRHSDLVKDIESGKMTTLSMGCSVTDTICTKCGNVAADETEMCNHIRYEKGNYFYDEKGNKHRVAELCGHPTLEPNGGVNFIEASWVATPAFGGAVARNILTPTGMSPEMLRQAQKVLSEPPPQWLDGLSKAASTDVREVPCLPVSRSETPAKTKTRVGDYYAPDGPGAIIGEPGSAPEEILGFDFGDDEGGEGEKAKPEEKPEASPLDRLTDEIFQKILDRVTKKVQDELEGRGEEPSVQEPANSTGEDIIKQAAHKRAYRLGIEAILKSASCDAHLIDSVARFNSRMGVKVPRAIYMAALSLGPLSKHGSIEEWAVNAHSALNRTPSLGETKTLLRLGKLLDQMAAFTNHNHKVEESRNG